MPDADLDKADLRILRLLQDDGRLTNQELAARVGLSPSHCWRRTRALEGRGLVRGYAALLDRRGLGLGVLAFVRVVIDGHSAAEAREFEEAVARLDEVVACYAVAGDFDFLLQVAVGGLDDYAEFVVHTLRALPRIKEMQTTFVLKEVKPPAGWPIPG
jgi:DNA-binding Lrp family transcriptional regulator